MTKDLISNCTGYTPGPWRRGYMFGAATIEADSPTGDGSDCIVAMQVSERDVPLLLAAPDLLAALLPFAKFACDSPHVDEPICHNCRARAAIQKAESRHG